MPTLEIHTVKADGNYEYVYLRDDAFSAYMNADEGVLLGVTDEATGIVAELNPQQTMCSFVKQWWADDQFIPTAYYRTSIVAELYKRAAKHCVSEYVKWVTAEEMLNK